MDQVPWTKISRGAWQGGLGHPPDVGSVGVTRVAGDNWAGSPGRQVGPGLCCPLSSPSSPLCCAEAHTSETFFIPTPGAGTRGAGCGWLGLPRSMAAADAPAFFAVAGFPRADTPGHPGCLGGGWGKLQGISRPSPRSPRMHFCLTVHQAGQ